MKAKVAGNRKNAKIRARRGTQTEKTIAVMLIPDVRGEMEIARFKMAGGLINPLHN